MEKEVKKDHLDEVKGHLITDLAEAGRCSKEYVRKVISFERKANSKKAKALLRAAIALNRSIIKGKEIVKRELSIISEGDEA